MTRIGPSGDQQRFGMGGLAVREGGVSRREMLMWSAGFAGAIAVGGLARSVLGAVPRSDAKPLRILVLGGTAMLGPAVIDAALARGHRVAMFNRGKTEAARGTVIPKEVERFVGDRDPKKEEGLKALEGQAFDAVIDTSGLFPRHVRASAELVKKHGATRYIFISSISAYANHRTPDADESDELVVPEKPEAEEGDPGFVYTGELKRPCEQMAEAVFGDGATIVRPAYLVGPGDATGRFAHWPLRVREAGAPEHAQMLVPGGPDEPVQVVDVRDLGAWLIRVAEERIGGTFNACGPAVPWNVGQMLAACEEAAKTHPTYTWVTWEFLREQRQPVPILLPGAAGGDYAGFHRRKSAKAIAAGLTFRPLAETAAAILAWWDAQPTELRVKYRGRLTLEAEAKVLAAWKASH